MKKPILKWAVAVLGVLAVAAGVFYLAVLLVSALVFATPHQSGGTSWIPSFMSDEVKGMGRKVVCFEVVNHTQYETDYIFDRLIKEEELRRRLDFMTERTYRVAQEICGAA